MKITYKDKINTQTEYQAEQYDQIVVRAADINQIKSKHNVLVDAFETEKTDTAQNIERLNSKISANTAYRTTPFSLTQRSSFWTRNINFSIPAKGQGQQELRAAYPSWSNYTLKNSSKTTMITSAKLVVYWNTSKQDHHRVYWTFEYADIDNIVNSDRDYNTQTALQCWTNDTQSTLQPYMQHLKQMEYI